jgi:hypothetical protein
VWASLRWIIPVLLIAILVGCGGGKKASVKPTEKVIKGSVIGLLHYSDTDSCQYEAGCGPQFSILNESFNKFTATYGDLDPDHHHLLIQIQGKSTRLNKEDARLLGDMENGAVKVKRYRLLTKIPYYPFLPDKAQQYTRGKYGCELLWDKTYSWQLVEGRARLNVRMTNTFSSAETKPFLELQFDGNTGHMLQEISHPQGTNPCRQ